MFCGNCGNQLGINEKFCGLCGRKVSFYPSDENEISTDKLLVNSVSNELQGSLCDELERNLVLEENLSFKLENNSSHEKITNYAIATQDKPPQKPSSNRKWFVIGGIVLFLALLSGSSILFFGQNQRNERMFQDAVSQGHRYLEEMDFDNAELAFLRAIEIDSKQAEPYLALADVYIAMNETMLALNILERGLLVVMLEDRVVLEERRREISSIPEPYLYIPVEEKLPEVEEVVDAEKPFEPCDHCKALIAFHAFLSNPQSMMFNLWENIEGSYIYWNIDTIHNAELVNLRGDGTVQLLVVPPQIEDMWWGMPVLIFEYTGQQIEMIYKAFNYGEGGQWDLYQLASTSDNKSYLVNVRGAIMEEEERTYFALVNEGFTPMLTTRKHVSRYEEVDGEWRPVIDYAYVNGQLVSEIDFERAAYEHLGIVDTRRITFSLAEERDIRSLLLYIENRLNTKGITLPDSELEESEDIRMEEQASFPPENWEDWFFITYCEWGDYIEFHSSPHGGFVYVFNDREGSLTFGGDNIVPDGDGRRIISEALPSVIELTIYQFMGVESTSVEDLKRIHGTELVIEHLQNIGVWQATLRTSDYRIHFRLSGENDSNIRYVVIGKIAN